MSTLSVSGEVFSFLGLLEVGLKKVLISFSKFIAFSVSSFLGLTVFSFNEAAWLRLLFVPLRSMYDGSVVSLQFKILLITGQPSSSWYNASIISSYIEMICFFFTVQGKPLSNKESPGLLEQAEVRNVTLVSTSQWFVLLSQVDIWLVERFPLEDDQRSFHLFGTSWLRSNRRDFPSHVHNPNTRFQLDSNIFYNNEYHVQLSQTLQASPFFMSFNSEARISTKKVKYFVRIEFECFIYYASTQKECLRPRSSFGTFFRYLIGHSYVWLQRWSAVSVEVVLK